MPDEQAPLDLSTPRRIHVVGVGGAGMSAIATVLAGMGHMVSGSDLKGSRPLARLRPLGVDARIGHDPVNVPARCDAVVRSTAVPESNVEIAAARERGIPVLRRAELLGAITRIRRVIAVAGSHGKTTTSSMLAVVLRGAGWRPSFVIGGDLNEVGTNAAADEGEWLVVEADESDGTFLELAAETAIVTNVEPDHLDHYGDFESLVAAFGEFLDAVPGVCVVGADDAIAASLAAERSGIRTYGWAEDADYRMTGYEGGRVGTRFVLGRHGDDLGVVEVPVPGRHNAVNAAGAVALAVELGVPFDVAARALASFGGVARRFQFRGEAQGVTFVDDYAHLPGEVAAAIHAAREGAWNRVIAVFQPHRYTRTASLWREFADSFTEADRVVLTDVYAAGEVPLPGISGRLVLRAVLEAHPTLEVAYLPRRPELVEVVPRLARAGDLVLTLGAGDVTTLPDAWLDGSEATG